MNKPSTYTDLVNGIIDIVNYLIYAFYVFLYAYLIWKMIDCWILNAGDEKKTEEGKKYLFASIIAGIIFFTLFAFIKLLKTSLFG